VAVGLSALSGLLASGASAAAQSVSFDTPMPVPPTLTTSHIQVHIRQAAVQLAPGQPTQMWTYNGTFPGPTIRRPAGSPTWVTFTNDLPAAAGPMTVHFHGAHNPDSEDGQPSRYLIAPGQGRKYTYPLIEDGAPERGAFRWYHDHAMGETSRNVWNGEAGMFIVDDKLDQSLPLPKGAYDVPLMIADRALLADNQLKDYFSNQDPNPLNDAVPQGSAPPGDASTGEHVLVNGASAPHLDVADRRYRLRLLNASNFTAYNLHLSNDAEIVQVGTDSGLLPAPVRRRTILLGPAERADVIVDFHGQRGRNVVLQSVPRDDQGSGGTGSAGADLMQFHVNRSAPDDSSIPARLRPLPAWTAAASSVPTRVWNFALGYQGQSVWTINGQTFDPNRSDAQVPLGSTETWELTNTSTVTHYVHMHDVSFLELSRDGHAPDPWEAGLKDTFRVDPGEHVVVAAKFPDYTGRFMIHCHMLDHEDHGMMGTFAVVGPGGLGVPPDPGPDADPGSRAGGSRSGPAARLGLPSARRCRSRRRMVLRLRAPGAQRLATARVYVNGRLVARLGRAQLARRLALTGLPAGHFRIRVVARTTGGRKLTAQRTYRACPSRHHARAAVAPARLVCHLTVL